jgi:hypothetical protein
MPQHNKAHEKRRTHAVIIILKPSKNQTGYPAIYFNSLNRNSVLRPAILLQHMPVRRTTRRLQIQYSKFGPRWARVEDFHTFRQK